MARDDLEFGFDTSFFDKGINKVMSGFSAMENTASKVAKGVNRGLSRVIRRIGVLAAGFLSVRKALQNMPEVGQAFGIAKDVFIRNLLFPLRKEIFPLLQRMLDWVRDSRTRFVRWGVTIANIFRSITAGARNIIRTIRNMSENLANFASRIFGDRVRDIEEITNLIIFKFATIIQFATLMFDKLGGFISSIFASTEAQRFFDSFIGFLDKVLEFGVGTFQSFFSGITAGLSGSDVAIDKLADAFIRLFNAFGRNGFEGWNKFVEDLGIFTGELIVASIDAFARALDGLVSALENLDAFRNKDQSFWQNFMDFRERRGPFFDPENLERALQPPEDITPNIFGRTRNVNDAILRPDGTIVETHPDDTLVALKDLGSSLSGLNGSRVEQTTNVSIDFTGMQINVQNGGIEEGQAFAEGLIEQIRDAYNSEFERFGA